MKLYRHVSTQLITSNHIKLNKVAVENNWNPCEIKWKETSSNKAKQHAANQIAVKPTKLTQQQITVLSLII